MSILVLNAGSSSLRFALFDKNLKELTQGHVDGIGQKNGPCRTHEEAIDFALKAIQKNAATEIIQVAHRVVHGGEKYRVPTLLTRGVLRALEKISPLAPLHNPINILAIRAAQKRLPKAKHYAIFDTAFHATLPEEAFLYGLPYSYYSKQNIRRYGFHGISHKYVSIEAARLLKNKRAKIITCHLGNGVSLAAVKNGISVDTTMGFTPLEGPIMGTRSGSIDPGILFHLLKKMPAEKLHQLLEKESGFKGLSGISSDVRNLWAKPKSAGTLRSFAVFSHQMAKLILGLCASLEARPDAIVFTAGVGENAYYLRAQIADHLKAFGVLLDPAANRKNALVISTAKSSIKVLVIPTNEALQMARELSN